MAKSAPTRPSTNIPTSTEALETLRREWRTADPAGRAEIDRQARAVKLIDAVVGAWPRKECAR